MGINTDTIAAFELLSRMRFACGDGGKRMQDELEVYLRELKRDAERYRWLRDESGNDIAAPFVCGVHGAPMGDAGWLTGDLLDAAIDAAMNGANA